MWEGVGAWLYRPASPAFSLIFDRFKSRRRLEIENLYLRHQCDGGALR
jgi:hypothetical protein